MRKPAPAIRVQPVVSRADEKRFFDLPRRVYSRDRNWVEPLRGELAAKLAPDGPFSQHGKLQRFIASVSGNDGREKTVGRIVAGVDFNQTGDDAKVGLIGFFECVQNFAVAQALFNSACNWLKAQGMTTARNSIARSDSGERLFYEQLILVDGFASPPMLMTPYNPPYYPEYFERAGWTKFKDAYAYRLDLQKGLPKTYEATLSKGYRSAVEAGINFRPINVRGKDFERDCEAIYDLAFEQLNFEGPHREEFLEEIKILKTPLGVPDACILAEDKTRDNKVVGVALCMPDYNILLRQLRGSYNPLGLLRALRYLRRVDQGRGVLIGSLPEYRRQGVPMALYYRAMKLTTLREFCHYKSFELSWLFDDNFAAQMLAEVSGAQIYKTYRIYEKIL
jgi:GNAT superfamily N-acetyltransferase